MKSKNEMNWQSKSKQKERRKNERWKSNVYINIYPNLKSKIDKSENYEPQYVNEKQTTHCKEQN